MVAKTFDAEKEFDLFEKFKELITELQSIKYDTISSANMLQLISLILEKDCTRKTILKLEKKAFIDVWDSAVNSVKKAIDFFRGYGVPVSKLLPYNALLVSFSYFFYKHPTNPSGKTLELLEDFFWRISLGYRYSSSLESKLTQDIEKIEKILNEELPTYEWSIDISTENIINNGYFSTGRSFIKAILCLYTMQTPKSFDNNLKVNLDNSWLKIATSKNYHHFFPKAFMKKNFPDTEEWLCNHILNITIVDDFLNKNKIRAKAPSVYMSDFKKENKLLDETMKTHLIYLNDFGIWENDYDLFFDKRADLVSKKLSEKIIQPKINNINLEKYEDIDEELLEE